MSTFEELQDALGRNTVCLHAQSASVTWTVSAEESPVDEQQELIVQTTTELRDDELKLFTQRYREGWVTFMPLHGEYKCNENNQFVVGLLRQSDMTLAIRLLVHTTYLAGLSTILTRPASPPITISVWPYKKLWEWSGEGWLEIRHWEVTVGSINLKTAMQR